MKEKEPPDPGGANLQVGMEIVVDSESSMDTDASVSGKNLLKRKSHKRCRQCNKKRRKNGSGNDYTCDCSSDTVTELPSEQSVPLKINSTDPKSTDGDNNTTNKTNNVKIGRTLFSSSDSAPFTIHVQLSQKSTSSSLHPVSFGRFLVRGNFRNVINGSVKRIGRTRISMAFSNVQDANNFLADPRLEAENLMAYIPTFVVTRMGLVRGIPAEWSDEEILQNISVPIGCGKIIKLRRMNHRVIVNGAVTWQPSETVVFTFDGQVLPKRIFSCYNALPVTLYIFPTIQCFNCCKYGHTKTYCRSKPTCFKCGQMHSADTCSVEEDCAICFWCGGFHYATNKSCLEYKRQQAIKTTMANNCISYAEAAKLHPPPEKPSYKDALLSQPPSLVPQDASSHSTQRSSPTSIGQQSSGYRKTVFLKPREPRSTQKRNQKGYDQSAHNALVNSYAIPSPSNGCALQEDRSDDQSVAEAIKALIRMLSDPNRQVSSHVAPLLDTLADSIKQNGQYSSMELQKCNT